MITFDEKNQIFQIDTKRTSYLIGIIDKERFLMHIYYGPKIKTGQDARYLLRIAEPPFLPSHNIRERGSFMDCMPFEFPGDGFGDYRDCAIAVEDSNGQSGCLLLYESYDILEGKPSLSGLPSTFAGKEKACQTLVLHCSDVFLGLKADLYYADFYEEDCLTRWVVLTNEGQSSLKIKKILSASIDMDNRSFGALSLSGSWARERMIERTPLTHGRFSVSSHRGISSHQAQPFLALVSPETDQEHGEVYAMHFVYSGNFAATAQPDQFDRIRMNMGISPYHFSWKLDRGERFTAPEVVLTYSDGGLGAMTRNFHDLYRRHLIRSTWLHKDRPVLLNSWEAAYFNFDEEKLLKMADAAADCGIEMLVMDDGWFGHRDADDSSLGDWTADRKKLPKGLKHLSDEIHARGLRFGIWMEPEMMSLDSKLFLQHPDWVIRLKNRPATLSRAQYVLDLSREDVQDYVWKAISDLLHSAKIEYLKWDMNRQLTDLGSYALPADRQGELSHRYTLGVYHLQEKLLQEFPDLLLENCSSGGGRFDPGMLYYSPQIWCSDNTDAVERLSIQEGTELLYPLSTMGAHVSVSPNDMTGRYTPFVTRCDVALSGTFGYELDVSKISRQEKEQIPEQIRLYKRFGELIREGDYYRIVSGSGDHDCNCWMIAAKDKSEALFTFVQILSRPNRKSRILRLQGLDPDCEYKIEWIHDAPQVPRKEYHNPDVYSGEMLMRAGLLIPEIRGDFQSRLLYLHKV